MAVIVARPELPSFTSIKGFLPCVSTTMSHRRGSAVPVASTTTNHSS